MLPNSSVFLTFWSPSVKFVLNGDLQCIDSTTVSFLNVSYPKIEDKKTKFDEMVAIVVKNNFVNNFALSLIMWLWWSLASPGGDVIWVNK